jgi:hypothetical protein
MKRYDADSRGVVLMEFGERHAWFLVPLENRYHGPKGESLLWYHLRNAMRAEGHDVVKRCPGKDGHLTSAAFYLRDRKEKFAVFHNSYAIRLLQEEIVDGMLTLEVAR